MMRIEIDKVGRYTVLKYHQIVSVRVSRMMVC